MFIKEYLNRDSNYIIVDSLDNHLSGFKKLNIFVGANNSGKSRFLREIFIGKTDDFVFFNDLNEKLIKIHEMLLSRFKDFYYMKNLREITSSRTGEYVSRFNNFYNTLVSIKSETSSTSGISNLDVARNIVMEMSKLGIDRVLKSSDKINRRHIYIPILRGIRHLDRHDTESRLRDFYAERAALDYKLNFDEEAMKKFEIFSGLPIYKEIKKMLLGSKSDRENIKRFEEFLSESFFENKQITLIPSHEGDILSVNIDNDENDREIFNVGDGIQSIIINTFQAFKYKNENLALFIEEPEMTMHPSMQRILIETLINKFENLQVFLTTHSNHFLDLAYDYPEDVAIFSFNKRKNEKFDIRNITENTKILDLLGVRNSSVFLSNCVIWTEGVTDRMLLRELLKLKGIKRKEDYHYSFAEYGGSNLPNFDFIGFEDSNQVRVQSMTKHNYVIADNDNINDKKSKKYIRRKHILKVLGKDRFFDKHIEIENLIPYIVWKKAIEIYLKDHSGHKIELKEESSNVETTFDNHLKNKKIGVLLKKYLVKKKNSETPKYFKEEGVKCLGPDKKEIMKYVIRAISELNFKFNKLPSMTKDLINSLVKFIDESN